METDLFQSCGHCWVFQICWHIECSIFTASSFRIWNKSPGIPSPTLDLFIMMLSKAHLTSHPGCLALGEWSHHHDYPGCEDIFLYKFLCVFLPPLLNTFCFCQVLVISVLYCACVLQFMGSQRVGHDWATELNWTCMKNSVGISNFPGEISSLSHFILHIRWPKYWSFSFCISLSNEYSGLISFRWTGLISLLSKGLSGVFSSTTIWKRQFFGV